MNPIQRTGREPLKGRTPLFTPSIDVGISSLGSRAPFLVGANQLELIVVAGILNDGIHGPDLQSLVPGPKLIKDVRIPEMKGAKKKHHQKDWG
jgi:hypothetical protein